MWITDWTTRAACKGTDPDELFVQGAAQNRAKLICRGCPVRTECLADALDNGIEFGVWGGMTERERRALLRRRPDVKSWRELLETARDRYERQGIDELVASARPSCHSSQADRLRLAGEPGWQRCRPKPGRPQSIAGAPHVSPARQPA
jgi:WhiB family redox-sensing transcriptional regulator